MDKRLSISALLQMSGICLAIYAALYFRERASGIVGMVCFLLPLAGITYLARLFAPSVTAAEADHVNPRLADRYKKLNVAGRWLTILSLLLVLPSSSHLFMAFPPPIPAGVFGAAISELLILAAIFLSFRAKELVGPAVARPS